MTRDTVNTLSVKLEMMEKNHQEFKQDLKEIKWQLNSNMWLFIDKIEQLEKKMEERFASKRTEKAVYWVITSILWYFIFALSKTIFK